MVSLENKFQIADKNLLKKAGRDQAAE